MAYTNTLSKSIIINIQMNWQNVQHMDKRERKVLIKQVVKMSRSTTPFILWSSKFHLAYLLHNSECYFNGKGYTTKVKEFDALGWYNSKNELDLTKVMQ